MEIFELTPKGQYLASNIYAPNKPAWRVIHYLNRKGAATKDQINDFEPNITGHKLYELRRKGVIKLVGRTTEV